MDRLTLLSIAIALSMDAFAVAVVTGLTLQPLTKRQLFRMSFHFGLFQALMPMVGWLAGRAVREHIASLDHWVAFALLAFVGLRMIKEAFEEKSPERVPNDPTKGWDLVALSVATSIDALAVGLSLGMVETTILLPALIIGLVTGTLTLAGMLLGSRIGELWSRRVEVLGGVILIAIGVKIVLEHAGFSLSGS